MARCDLAILGGGPGGMAAALSGATRGLNVVLIDGGSFLGYGLHGAYKSKALWEAARDWISAERLGWACIPEARGDLFDKIHARVEMGMTDLTGMYLRYLNLKKVRFVRGFGTFAGPHTISVDDERIEADSIIIATGSSPRLIEGVKVDGTRIMTSDDIVDIRERFDSLIVIGAGVLGCEFSSIFSALGVRVTLLDRAMRLLGNEDPDIGELLTDVYLKNEVDVRRAARVKSVKATNGKVRTELHDGSSVATDRALISIGRVPCSANLNLQAVGIQTDPWGFIPVNENLQTNLPHVYAVGDVGQRNTPLDLALVQVAEAEGRMAVKHVCGESIDIHPGHIPFIIFTLPMIAGAGLNETQAGARSGKIRVAKFSNIRNHRYRAMQSHEGFLKLIVGPPGDDCILGVRAIGPEADNVIGEVAVLIDKKVPYNYLLDCIHAHPSLAESLQNAARVIAGILPPEV
ncbi:MAG TPA: NAD(P)/FAD-dependent oxidoreductase [Candidatus Binatia bacterium]|nr:NAD(P)/FAD-dependent oxidoreductase [Candidatus Binatia bacterium]